MMIFLIFFKRCSTNYKHLCRCLVFLSTVSNTLHATTPVKAVLISTRKKPNSPPILDDGEQSFDKKRMKGIIENII